MKTFIVPLVVIFSFSIFSCGESIEEYKKRRKAEYHADLKQFKTDSLDLIKKKFELLQYYGKAYKMVTNVAPKAEHKEIEVLIQDKYPSIDFNTIYLHQSYYQVEENHDYPLPSYKNLYNIRRLIKGEELEFGKDGDLNESPDKLIEFKEYCKNFVKAKYIIIQGGIDVKLPSLYDVNSYNPGYYKGLFTLFEFSHDSRNILDAFLFEATSSQDFEAVDNQNLDRAIIQNLLNQTGITIFKEMQDRYSCRGEFPNQYIADHVKIKSTIENSSKYNN